MPVQKAVATEFRATRSNRVNSERSLDLARKNYGSVVWNFLVAADIPGFRRVLRAVEKYTPIKTPGNRRAYRVEDLPGDLADEILNAKAPEPTPHLDRLLKPRITLPT